MKGTLVQIHYHNRPGGVVAVMEQYARTFREIVGGTGMCITVCAKDRKAAGSSFQKIVNVKECKYRTFSSARSFLASAGTLRWRLQKIIADPSIVRPVIVAGHNLNLCKNAALSKAFADLAHAFADQGDDFRFFAVVHDFAEQGRTEQMLQVRFLERHGIRMRDVLYPAIPNLRYVAVSKATLKVLRTAGFAAHFVPNPIVLPYSRMKPLRRKKAIHASKSVNGKRPVLFYPGRTISRKNPVEALVLSHCLFSATLVLGEEGTSAPDRALARRLRELCSRYKIAAIFCDKRREESGNVVYSHLYRIADACVSTSVLEGFGYALYEPWQYGKAVVGRLPCGTAPSEIPGGAGLYRQLFVPKEWIDIAELKRLYLRQMKLCFGNHLSTGNAGAFSRAFDREFVRGKGIDFGCLDIGTQCAVFEAVCRSGKRAEDWKKAFPAQTRFLAESWERALHPSTTAVAANQRRIKAGHGTAAFASSFAVCFGKRRTASANARPDYRRIQRHFCSLARFRLLATPQAPGASHYCTVSA